MFSNKLIPVLVSDVCSLAIFSQPKLFLTTPMLSIVQEEQTGPNNVMPYEVRSTVTTC